MYNGWEPRVNPLLNPSEMLVYNIKKFKINNSILLQITEIWKLTHKSNSKSPAMLVNTWWQPAIRVIVLVGRAHLVTSQRANTL